MDNNPKVIFLDVDGVLNRFRDTAMLDLIPELIQQLARIVDETDATIVLSSFWRYSPKMTERLKATLADYGLKIHSHTPKTGDMKMSGIVGGKQRGHEIQQWIDEHWTPERFVIIDDNMDMCHLLPHLVKTSPYYGLTIREADAAIARLNSPSS